MDENALRCSRPRRPQGQPASQTRNLATSQPRKDLAGFQRRQMKRTLSLTKLIDRAADFVSAGGKRPKPLLAAMLIMGFASFGLALSGEPRHAFAQSGGDGQSVGTLAPRPEALQRRVAVRFLTGQGFPPFNYYDEDNILTGFNVDIARAICLEMGASCDIKAKPWDQLIPSLLRGDADAIVGSQLITPARLQQLDFTDRYYHTPARFIALRKSPKLRMTPVGLEARKIGVVKGTTHEAYLKDFFQDSRIVGFENSNEARAALIKGDVDAVFGDAISLSFWINGTLSRSCCEFRGGAFAEPRYFGDGIGIAVVKGDTQLRALINNALQDVRNSGRYEELFLRYFPIKFY